MVTSLYAFVFVLLMLYLIMRVVNVRKSKRILYADGGDELLAQVRTAQMNAYENIPIFLILMILLELNQAPIIILHALGICMLIARITHSYGVLNNKLQGRIKGMILTIIVIAITAALNLAYLPYDRVFNF